MKKGIILVVLVIIGVLGWYGYKNFLKSSSSGNLINTKSTTENTTGKTPLTSEIEAVLVIKLQLLENLAKQPNVLSAIEAQNVKNAGLTQSKIKEYDDAWIATKGTDDFINSFLINGTANTLATFQD